MSRFARSVLESTWQQSSLSCTTNHDAVVTSLFALSGSGDAVVIMNVNRFASIVVWLGYDSTSSASSRGPLSTKGKNAMAAVHASA